MYTYIHTHTHSNIHPHTQVFCIGSQIFEGHTEKQKSRRIDSDTDTTTKRQTSSVTSGYEHQASVTSGYEHQNEDLGYMSNQATVTHQNQDLRDTDVSRHVQHALRETAKQSRYDNEDQNHMIDADARLVDDVTVQVQHKVLGHNHRHVKQAEEDAPWRLNTIQNDHNNNKDNINMQDNHHGNSDQGDAPWHIKNSENDQINPGNNDQAELCNQETAPWHKEEPTYTQETYIHGEQDTHDATDQSKHSSRDMNVDYHRQLQTNHNTQSDSVEQGRCPQIEARNMHHVDTHGQSSLGGKDPGNNNQAPPSPPMDTTMASQSQSSRGETEIHNGQNVGDAPWSLIEGVVKKTAAIFPAVICVHFSSNAETKMLKLAGVTHFPPPPPREPTRSRYYNALAVLIKKKLAPKLGGSLRNLAGDEMKAPAFNLGMYVCMHVCMYVCIHVVHGSCSCMYVCMYVQIS
jgi:hypothetical protein